MFRNDDSVVSPSVLLENVAIVDVLIRLEALFPIGPYFSRHSNTKLMGSIMKALCDCVLYPYVIDTTVVLFT